VADLGSVFPDRFLFGFVAVLLDANLALSSVRDDDFGLLAAVAVFEEVCGVSAPLSRAASVRSFREN